MANSVTATTPKEKAGETKRSIYDKKIRGAIAELVLEKRVWPISKAEICAKAGVSEDPLSKQYHAELNMLVLCGPALVSPTAERKNTTGNALKTPAEHRLSAQLAELEEKYARARSELIAVKKKLENCQIALNVVGQMLNSATTLPGGGAIIPFKRIMPVSPVSPATDG